MYGKGTQKSCNLCNKIKIKLINAIVLKFSHSSSSLYLIFFLTELMNLFDKVWCWVETSMSHADTFFLT